MNKIWTKEKIVKFKQLLLTKDKGICNKYHPKIFFWATDLEVSRYIQFTFTGLRINENHAKLAGKIFIGTIFTIIDKSTMQK